MMRRESRNGQNKGGLMDHFVRLTHKEASINDNATPQPVHSVFFAPLSNSQAHRTPHQSSNSNHGKPATTDSSNIKQSVLTKRGRPPQGAQTGRGEKKWKCGCGKEYLTYGALYSHTRVQHGGVQPPGSVRLRDENRKPRVANAHIERLGDREKDQDRERRQ